MMLVPALMGAILMISMVSMWIEKRSLFLERGMVFPDRLIAWGQFDHGTERQESFFFVKLPSYLWGETDYGRKPCWLQRVLCYTSNRGWFISHFEAKQRA